MASTNSVVDVLQQYELGRSAAGNGEVPADTAHVDASRKGTSYGSVAKALCVCVSTCGCLSVCSGDVQQYRPAHTDDRIVKVVSFARALWFGHLKPQGGL